MTKTSKIGSTNPPALTVETIRARKDVEARILALTTKAERIHPYLIGHVAGVAWIAVAIAKELGFNAEQMEGLRLAATAHDVGMADIPVRILAKTGPLTAEERRVVERHCQHGRDRLAAIGSPWPLAEITLEHHERYDGSGYPRGLTGNDILTEAQIIGVADTVEAMSANRPHHTIPGIAKAVDHIRASRGTLYRQDVADAAISVFKNSAEENKD